MHIRYAARTDKGRIRESNEDSYAADPKHRLFLVADGMGGHAAGEIASNRAAEAVQETVATRQSAEVSPEETLRDAAREANSRIYEEQREHPERAGMGSTLTALYLKEGLYYIAQVGDSRAYLLREKKLEQLTRDHSWVWQLYETGVRSKEDLRHHPQKNLITRSVGPHPHVEIDIEHGEAREGDVFLLCSDGLSDMVPDHVIQDILGRVDRSPGDIGKELIAAANKAGGHDNITVVVVRIETGSAQEEGAGKFPAVRDNGD